MKREKVDLAQTLFCAAELTQDTKSSARYPRYKWVYEVSNKKPVESGTKAILRVQYDTQINKSCVSILGDGSNYDLISDSFVLASVAARAQESTVHRNHIDFESLGLVLKKIPNPEDHSSGARLVPENTGANGSRPPSAMIRKVAPKKLDGLGWFAPEANPAVFGTLYIQPYSGGSRSEERIRNLDGWVLYQIGSKETVEVLSWANKAAVAEAARRLIEDSVEDQVVAVLSVDAEHVAELDAKNKAAVLYGKAREDFSPVRNRIKRQTLDSAIRGLNGGYNYPHTQTNRRGLENADGVEVKISILANTLQEDTFRHQPSIPAAAQIVFMPNNTDFSFHSWNPENWNMVQTEMDPSIINKIVTALATDNLGTLVQVNLELPDGSSLTQLWVTKNVELFKKHYNACFGKAKTEIAPEFAEIN